MRDVLLLSPHSDDVAWSAGGLARRLGRDGGATLVTVFARSGFGPGLPGAPDAEQVTAARRGEDARFARACGLADAALDRVDALLRGVPFRELFRGADGVADPEADALALQLEALREAGGDPLAVAPLGLGRHVDHFSCRDAARRVFDPASLVFYEDLPYAAEAGVEGCAAHALRWLGAAARSRLVPLEDPGRKQALVLLYASQLGESTWPKIRDHALALRPGGAERFWGTSEALAALDERLAGR